MSRTISSNSRPVVNGTGLSPRAGSRPRKASGSQDTQVPWARSSRLSEPPRTIGSSKIVDGGEHEMSQTATDGVLGSIQDLPAVIGQEAFVRDPGSSSISGDCDSGVCRNPARELGITYEHVGKIHQPDRCTHCESTDWTWRWVRSARCARCPYRCRCDRGPTPRPVDQIRRPTGSWGLVMGPHRSPLAPGVGCADGGAAAKALEFYLHRTAGAVEPPPTDSFGNC